MPATLITATELETMSFPNQNVELVLGKLVVREPPGAWHSSVSLRLGARLLSFVDQHGLGTVLGQDSGYKIASEPDTVRGADVSFVSRQRLPDLPRGFPSGSPDLVVEVLSPGDRPGEVMKKIGEWLDGGARLVWIIDPDRAEARICRADGSISIVPADGALDGEDVLPGFRCELREVLPKEQ